MINITTIFDILPKLMMLIKYGESIFYRNDNDAKPLGPLNAGIIVRNFDWKDTISQFICWRGIEFSAEISK